MKLNISLPYKHSLSSIKTNFPTIIKDRTHLSKIPQSSNKADVFQPKNCDEPINA